MDEGFVVIDPQTDFSAREAVSFLTNMLKQQLLNDEKPMDYLRHICLRTPKHAGHTWRQLYPSLGGDRIKQEPWTINISCLRLFLKKCIYPDNSFAQIAHKHLSTSEKTDCQSSPAQRFLAIMECQCPGEI